MDRRREKPKAKERRTDEGSATQMRVLSYREVQVRRMLKKRNREKERARVEKGGGGREKGRMETLQVVRRCGDDIGKNRHIIGVETAEWMHNSSHIQSSHTGA